MGEWISIKDVEPPAYMTLQARLEDGEVIDRAWYDGKSCCWYRPRSVLAAFGKELRGVTHWKLLPPKPEG